MAHVLGMERYRLYIDFARELSGKETHRFAELVGRRAMGEPLQYLTGSTEFMSLGFATRPGALIPRPETEILVETVMRLAWNGEESDKVVPLPTLLEVGAGSGAIALSLAHYLPRAVIYATEISPDALDLAHANAETLGLAGRVRFMEGDLFGPLEGSGLEEGFAAVVSNPPYVPRPEIPLLPREVRDHEPLLALDGGPDGLDAIRRLAAEAPRWLRPRGLLAFEVGAGQAGPVTELLEGSGRWCEIRTFRDYTEIDRVVTARKAAKARE